MFDQKMRRYIRPVLLKVVVPFAKFHVNPDCITVIGFLIGMFALPLLVTQHYIAAMVLMLINRFMDGLDGELARKVGKTGAGGFLDITLDFLFYGAFVLGFVLGNSLGNAIVAAVLLFTFLGAGTSFLAFAVMVEKYGLEDFKLEGKSFYYVTKGVEGGETILAFIIFCSFPEYFAWTATVFAVMCLWTVGYRVIYGYRVIKKIELNAVK